MTKLKGYLATLVRTPEQVREQQLYEAQLPLLAQQLSEPLLGCTLAYWTPEKVAELITEGLPGAPLPSEQDRLEVCKEFAEDSAWLLARQAWSIWRGEREDHPDEPRQVQAHRVALTALRQEDWADEPTLHAVIVKALLAFED